jgi:argininosuccinate synthase
VYQGQWFAPVKDALLAFVDKALEPVTGEVTVELFQGAARAVARTSPRSLYSPALASFDMTGYEPRDAEGFIKVFGRPVAAARHAGEAATKPEEAPRG